MSVRTVLVVAWCVVALAAMASAVVLALHDLWVYPDATEMRRFLMRWPYYMATFGVCSAFLFWEMRTSRRRPARRPGSR